jgi:hypothetical protein
LRVPLRSPIECVRFGYARYSKLLVGGDQRVKQAFAVLEVHVVVAGAVHEQQVALQVASRT